GGVVRRSVPVRSDAVRARRVDRRHERRDQGVPRQAESDLQGPMTTIEGSGKGAGRRVAVVVAKWNDFVTERLRTGAVSALTAAGVAADAITTVRVPGSFEIPIAAQHAAESGRFDAIVCIGCIIRGETPHFEYLASAVAQGITAAASASG